MNVNLINLLEKNKIHVAQLMAKQILCYRALPFFIQTSLIFSQPNIRLPEHTEIHFLFHHIWLAITKVDVSFNMRKGITHMFHSLNLLHFAHDHILHNIRFANADLIQTFLQLKHINEQLFLDLIFGPFFLTNLHITKNSALTNLISLVKFCFEAMFNHHLNHKWVRFITHLKKE